MRWWHDFLKYWKCWLKKVIHLVMCFFGPKPPAGNAPTPAQKTNIENLFPNLRTWSVTAPATGGPSTPGSYNCIAWSVGVTNAWLWPGETVPDFDIFYASYGWSVSASGNREYKKRKVALYAHHSDPNDCTHGSREVSDCGWEESKLGGLERIMHIRSELEAGSYGNIIRYYEKPDENANSDLC